MNLSHKVFDKLKSLRVYVAQDCTGHQYMLPYYTVLHSCQNLCTVFTGDVEDMLQKGREDSGGQDCAVLVLIPIRLGGEILNEIYFPCIKVRQWKHKQPNL